MSFNKPNDFEPIETYDDYNSEFSYDGESNEIIEEQKKYYALWGAVILQALIDATSHSKRAENKLEKIRATAWLTDLGVDFTTVCGLANYDPIYVYKKAISVIKSRVKSNN